MISPREFAYTSIWHRAPTGDFWIPQRGLFIVGSASFERSGRAGAHQRLL